MTVQILRINTIGSVFYVVTYELYRFGIFYVVLMGTNYLICIGSVFYVVLKDTKIKEKKTEHPNINMNQIES